MALLGRFRRVLLFGVCGVALACLGFSPRLQAEQLTVDPARSEVHFTLADMLHTVHGTFHIQRGEIVFSPADGKASGSIVVDALSGQSGNSARDKRMTNQVLQSASFKTVTFTPIGFTGAFHASGDSALKVRGLFTILGTAHEIEVPMQIQVNGEQIHAIGTFTVPYVQWGMKDPSTMLLRVNKEVQIDLSLMGTLK